MVVMVRQSHLTKQVFFIHSLVGCRRVRADGSKKKSLLEKKHI